MLCKIAFGWREFYNQSRYWLDYVRLPSENELARDIFWYCLADYEDLWYRYDN
jgi:hypothetical protein